MSRPKDIKKWKKKIWVSWLLLAVGDAGYWPYFRLFPFFCRYRCLHAFRSSCFEKRKLWRSHRGYFHNFQTSSSLILTSGGSAWGLRSAPSIKVLERKFSCKTSIMCKKLCWPYSAQKIWEILGPSSQENPFKSHLFARLLPPESTWGWKLYQL